MLDPEAIRQMLKISKSYLLGEKNNPPTSDGGRVVPDITKRGSGLSYPAISNGLVGS